MPKEEDERPQKFERVDKTEQVCLCESLSINLFERILCICLKLEVREMQTFFQDKALPLDLKVRWRRGREREIGGAFDRLHVISTIADLCASVILWKRQFGV